LIILQSKILNFFLTILNTWFSSLLIRITAFQKRIEALAVGLIFDAVVDQSTYKGPGYHHPGNLKLYLPYGMIES